MTPPNLTDAAADDNYQSTPTDRKWGWGLGIGYILLAIFLAWMLFKIWPPTPWPTNKSLDENPQIAKMLADLECPPSACPSATPTPAPTPTPTTEPGATPAASSKAAPIINETLIPIPIPFLW